jgi:anti-anti-sigma factor
LFGSRTAAVLPVEFLSFTHFELSPHEACGGDVLPVRATGDLDVAVEQQARAELRAICGLDGVRAVRLFLGDAVFVDARGLDVLLDASAGARRHGRRLTIVAPPRCLIRMIDALELHTRLPTVAAPRDGAGAVPVDRPGPGPLQRVF